ncbi:unnamed protein product, partial [Rotaria sp. Silwood1]
RVQLKSVILLENETISNEKLWRRTINPDIQKKNLSSEMASFSLFLKILIIIFWLFSIISTNPIKANNNCIPLYKQCQIHEKCCDGTCQTVGRYQLCWSPPWGKRLI